MRWRPLLRDCEYAEAGLLIVTVSVIDTKKVNWSVNKAAGWPIAEGVEQTVEAAKTAATNATRTAANEILSALMEGL